MKSDTYEKKNSKSSGVVHFLIPPARLYHILNYIRSAENVFLKKSVRNTLKRFFDGLNTKVKCIKKVYNPMGEKNHSHFLLPPVAT